MNFTKLAVFCAWTWIAIDASMAADDLASTYDFVVLAPSRPIPLRLELRVEGQEHKAAWGDFLGKLFAFLDVDGDGRLSASEARRAPSPALLRVQLRGDFINVPAQSDRAIPLAPGSNNQSSAEFAAAHRRSGVVGIDIVAADDSRGIDDRLNQLLFAALAGGEDRWLTQEAFRKAIASIRRFDVNEDDRLGAGELAIDLHRLKPAESTGDRRARGMLFDHVGTMTQSSLADWYATEGDRWHATLVNRFSQGKAVKLSGNFTSTMAVARGSLPPQRGNSASNKLEIGYEFRRGNGDSAVLSARQELRQQFEIDDANGDGQLHANEITLSPLSPSWQTISSSADRNGDGKLSLGECNAYLDVLMSGAAKRVEIHLGDQGHPLFTRLDTDGDGQLGARELLAGWLRVESWDADADGRVSWREIPTSLSLGLSVGKPELPAPQRSTSDLPAPTAGPPWFRKMDRNRDGDLSRHEFLGAADEFNRFDSDGDGFIDALEADRVQAKP